MSVEESKTNLYDQIAALPREKEDGSIDAALAIKQIYDDLLARHEDPLSLEQDIVLMRALVIDYINRWTDFSEALIEWYMDRRGKAPDKIMDLGHAAQMIEMISRVVKRMHEMRESSAVNIAAVRELMDRMAIVLTIHVKDADTLRAIAADWDEIKLNPKSLGSSLKDTSGD